MLPRRAELNLSSVNVRTDADSNCGDHSEITLPIDPPFFRVPPKKLNLLGLEEKPYYRTADACAVLRVNPDVLRWRLSTGKYPDVPQDGKGRRFTLDQLISLRDGSASGRADQGGAS